jgi:hypothetical protein
MGWGLLVYALALAVQIIFNQFILVILLALGCYGSARRFVFCQKKTKPAQKAHSHLQRAWHGAIIIMAVFHFSFPSTEASLQSSYQSDLSVHICAHMKEVKNMAIYFMVHKYLFVIMCVGNF